MWFLSQKREHRAIFEADSPPMKSQKSALYQFYTDPKINSELKELKLKLKR